MVKPNSINLMWDNRMRFAILNNFFDLIGHSRSRDFHFDRRNVESNEKSFNE